MKSVNTGRISMAAAATYRQPPILSRRKIDEKLDADGSLYDSVLWRDGSVASVVDFSQQGSTGVVERRNSSMARILANR
jgi:hypothetical protein